MGPSKAGAGVPAAKKAKLDAEGPPPAAAADGGDGAVSSPACGALVVCTVEQALRILLHFGPPEVARRCEPHQLLAVPCPLFQPDGLLPAVAEALDPAVHELAKSLRPDIRVELREGHLRDAVRQLGPALAALEDFCCLVAVSLPFGLDEVEASGSEEERRWRRDHYNQIDLHPTATGPLLPGDTSLAAAASRALCERCRVWIADPLWDEGLQVELRQYLGVNLPVRLADASGASVEVLLLPQSAVCRQWEQLFHIDMPSEVLPKQPPLPPGWRAMRYWSTGELYYENEATQEVALVAPQLPPLPDGWTERASKRNGRTYYYHAGRKVSQFRRPVE